MKNFLWLLLFLFLVFLGLIYLSVAAVPDKIKISEVISDKSRRRGTPTPKDSVLVVPTNLYQGNKLKRFMQGENYREAWSTAIKAPVFSLDTMKILEEGGGTQTSSLRLKSPIGFVYSLRSINKDPRPLVPEIAETLGLENVIIDGISAQHPYGAVLAASLSDIAGILHTHPKIVYVPKQSALGEFNEDYGNRLYLLEFETEGKGNWTDLPDFYEILDTEDLQELRMERGDKVQINKAAFVRARLFDLLIGDWDRHAKQWGWVVQKEGDNFVAVPLAGDRDNAFFRIDGVIPTILTNELVQPLVRPFEKDIDHVSGFVYPVDTYFLQNTSEELFVKEAEDLQQRMTDENLEKAFAAWPKEISALNKEEILEKLKSRRENLVEYAKKFYYTIQRRDLLEEPLKGSEDLEIQTDLRKCFECD